MIGELPVRLIAVMAVLAAAEDNRKICPEESTNEKSPVVWSTSQVSERWVLSSPLCLNEDQETITRRCQPLSWSPKHDDVPACHSIQSRPVLNSCPPDFEPVMDSDGRLLLCFRQTPASSWSHPCVDSGSSVTVLDLNRDELHLLKKCLTFTETRRKLVWLPAHRIVPYGPIVWTTIGDLWGRKVRFDDRIKYTRLPTAQSCLLLDLDKMTVKTDNCSYQYPSLCIFRGKHLLHLHCPTGFAATRYSHDSGRCYGIKLVENATTWDDFLHTGTCKYPLQISESLDNYLIQETSHSYDYDMKELCWMSLIKMTADAPYVWYPNLTLSFVNWDSQTNFSVMTPARGALNEKFRWTLLDKDLKLRCMTCQEMLTKKEIDLNLQYSNEVGKLHLTVYNQKYLWRESDDDIGMQCFTNLKGFVKIAEIESKPYRKTNMFLRELVVNNTTEKVSTNEVEKVVYEVETDDDDEPGEYWCEGHHSMTFELVTSPRVLVRSKKNPDEHVFVLKLDAHGTCQDLNDCNPDWDDEADRVKELLDAESVRIMEVEGITTNGSATILYHITVSLKDYDKCFGLVSCNMLHAYHAIKSRWLLILTQTKDFDFVSLRSTVYCLPEEEEPLTWDMTTIGDNTAPRELCMQSNGLPVTRQCGGSFMYGGQWRDVVGECSLNYEPTNRTALLFGIAKGHTDMEVVSSFLAHHMIAILDDKENMIPADVYFLSLSLKTIVEISDQNSSLVELGDANNIAIAVDSIMNIEESCLSLAQTMNSSNVLLESLDMILSKIAQNESEGIVDGLELAVTPQFVLQISNPSVSNVTGVAVVRRRGAPESPWFTDMEVVPLKSDITVGDMLALEGLEIATWLPTNLVNLLSFVNSTGNHTQQLTNIIIDIFYNGVVFQETKAIKDIVNSRVISMTLPGYESDLPLPLPILYRRFQNSDKRKCAYWDYSSTDHHASLGEWSRKGCYFVASHGALDLCACFHLTHFAQLLTGSKGNGENQGEIIILEYHGRALNAITLVGCSLSLVGVAGIVTTALLFKSWRRKPGTKVLLQLSAAVGLQMIMIVSQDGQYSSEAHCITVGALLHYSVLAAFTWMLLTALLQFARYVKVLGAQRPARFMVKFSLAGWGLPVVPVAILLLVNCDAYLPHDAWTPTVNSTRPLPAALCYPQGTGLYFSVLLPVACIVIVNLVVFVLVMRSVMYGPDGKRRSGDPELVLSQLRLCVVLFFLLGLSWIFGLLSVTGGRIIFSYLFCLTATLQGFVMFVYFVVCDPATRVLWVSLVRDRSISSVSSQ